MESRNKCSGFLNISILLLLLVINTCFSEDLQTADTSNWVETKTGKWPPADPSTGKTEKFYFYHGEFKDGVLFSIKDKFLSTVNLPTKKLDFSFKYWTTNATLFIAKSDAKLELTENEKANWKDSPSKQLKNITLEALKKFEIKNYSPFTLALKDVKVQYLEKVDLKEIAPIHAYHADSKDQLVRVKSGETKGEADGSKTHSFTVEKSEALKPEVAYLNLIETQLSGRDLCYALSLTDLPATVSIDVYFTFESINSGTKLLNIDGANSELDTSFCINDFIALQNVENFQLTFAFIGKVDADFSFEITKTDKESAFKIRNPGDEASTTDITSGWFYYNSLYDYTITGEKNQKIWACDVVANCFPYIETGSPGKYRIEKGYTDLFSKSPFIRIRIDDQTQVSQFSFTQKSDIFVHDSFKQQLIARNGYKAETKAKAFYKIKVVLNKVDLVTFDEDKTNKIKLIIPLDKIDLRTHQLTTKISVKSANPQPMLRLWNVAYNNRVDNATVNFPFQEPLQNLSIVKFDQFQFSSQSWFAVHPTDIQSAVENEKWIQFELEPTKANSTIEIEFTLEKATLAQIEEYPNLEDYATVKLKYFTRGEKITDNWQDAGDNFKLKGMREGAIFTNWIRAGVDQRLGDTKLDVEFSLQIGTESNAKLVINSMYVYRVILTQTKPIFTQLTSESFNATTDKVITIKDNLESNSNEAVKNEPLSGSFRISYIFMSKANVDSTITVEKFYITSPASKSAEQNCKLPTFALTDCKYDSNVCPFEENTFTDVSGECSFTNLYRYTEQVCSAEVGCANIFDRALATSTKSPSAIATYIPYQTTEGESITTHFLNYSLLTTRELEKDFCIQFDYASRSKSLLITASETAGYSFEFLETGFDDKNKVAIVKKATICASYLTDQVKEVKSFYFRFEQTPIVDTDSYYVTNIVPQDQNVNTDLNILHQGFYIDKTAESYFLQPHDPEWKFKNNVLSFEIPDLSTLKKAETFVSLLRTKWIEMPNPEHFGKFRLGLKLEGQNLTESLFVLSLKVSSPKETLIQETISSSNLEINDKMNILPIASKSVQYYQLTLEITLYLKDLELKATDPKKSFSINFNKFSINDPCVDENTNELVTCNKRAIESKPRCQQEYKTFTYKCPNCKSGYKGDHCEINDYCNQIDPDTNKANKVTCNNGGAECTQADGGFDCACREAKKNWDSSFKKCVTKAVKCKENQDSLVDNNGEVKCKCSYGYISLKGDDTDCVKYNPCEPKHREKVPNLDKTICKDKNAACQAEDETPSSNDHSCKCNAGYVNAFGDTGPATAVCLHVKCDFESNVCEQKCVPKGDIFECACFDGYSLDNGKCKPKDANMANKCQSKSTPAPFVNGNGYCDCVQWYKWNATDCVFDSDKNGDFATKFKCTKGAKLVDNKPACDCDAKTEVLDSETRTCKPRTECTQQEKDKCKSDHSANGCKIVNGLSVSCECGDLAVKYATSKEELDKGKWNCRGKCQLLSESGLKNSSLACNGDFQKCNDIKVITKQETSLNGTSFFVGGSSEIASKKADFCTCNMGFELSPDSSRCTPRKDPQVDVSIDFEVDKDPEIIRAYFEKLIKSKIEKNAPLDKSQCTKSKDTVSCSLSFPSDKTPGDIKKALDKACTPLEGSKCAYMLEPIDKDELKKLVQNRNRLHKRSMFAGTYYDSGSLQLTNVLVRDSTKAPTIENVDLCKTANPCTTFEFSLCQKISNISQHIECVCDPAIFDVKSSRLESIPKNKLQMSLQSCKVKNLCSQDSYKCQSDAKCNLDVVYDAGANRYNAQSFCTCGSDRNSSFTLPNRSLSCTQTCKNACGENFESCAQNIYDQKYTCLCKKGYEGAKCDSKTGANIFLYSTIAVSVVAVLAIIGLGIFYYKRRSR